MPEYSCCLCSLVSSNNTRKCIKCCSGEKRICDTCYGSRNKCLECAPESDNHHDHQNSGSSSVSTTPSKKGKKVHFSDSPSTKKARINPAASLSTTSSSSSSSSSSTTTNTTVSTSSPKVSSSSNNSTTTAAIVAPIAASASPTPVAAAVAAAAAAAAQKQTDRIDSANAAAKLAAATLTGLNNAQQAAAAAAATPAQRVLASVAAPAPTTVSGAPPAPVGPPPAPLGPPPAPPQQPPPAASVARAVSATPAAMVLPPTSPATVFPPAPPAAVVPVVPQVPLAPPVAAAAAVLVVPAVVPPATAGPSAPVLASVLAPTAVATHVPPAAVVPPPAPPASVVPPAPQAPVVSPATVVQSVVSPATAVPSAPVLALVPAPTAVVTVIPLAASAATAVVVPPAPLASSVGPLATQATVVPPTAPAAAAAAAVVPPRPAAPGPTTAGPAAVASTAPAAVVPLAPLAIGAPSLAPQATVVPPTTPAAAAAAAAVVVPPRPAAPGPTTAGPPAVASAATAAVVPPAPLAIGAPSLADLSTALVLPPASPATATVVPGVAALIEQEDLTVGTDIMVDPLIYGDIEKWPIPSEYQLLDTYQGVHPRKRRQGVPQAFYPLCKIFEHNEFTGLAKILWQIDGSTIIEETTTTNDFQRLLESDPKLLWWRNEHSPPMPVADALRSAASVSALVITASTGVSVLTTNNQQVVAPFAAVNNASISASISSTADLPTQPTSTTNAAEDPVDLTDDLSDKSAALPSKRKEYEKMMHEYLRVLYTEPFKYPYREVTVGGRKYQLDCFHYADSANSSQPEFKNKRGKKYEFVNKQGENIVIYRWEIKMALVTALQGATRSLVERVFFAFARYGSSSTDKKYDCCAVLIVRCVNRTPVFLMMEVSADPSIEHELQPWEGYDKIKHFYVMPEVPVDYDKLSRARLRYWDMNRHEYKEDRLIQIDTHRPGDITVDRATSHQVASSWSTWTIKHGPRDIFAELPKLSAEEKAQAKGVIKKEQAELTAAKTTISAKDSKINDLKKKLLQLEGQLKAKPVPPSLKRDIQTVQEDEKSRKRIVPPALPAIPVPTSNSSSRYSAEKVAANGGGSSEFSKMTDIEVSIHQKKLQLLELQLQSAQKQAALDRIQSEQAVLQARSNLELSGIHNDARELQHAARVRQAYLHDRDHSEDVARLNEDRAFQKESLRRQWGLEDRHVTHQATRDHNRDIADMASRTNQLPLLQSLLAAQTSSNSQMLGHLNSVPSMPPYGYAAVPPTQPPTPIRLASHGYPIQHQPPPGPLSMLPSGYVATPPAPPTQPLPTHVGGSPAALGYPPYGYMAVPPAVPPTQPPAPIGGAAAPGCSVQHQPPGPLMLPYGYVATPPAPLTQPSTPVGSATHGYPVQNQPGLSMPPYGYVVAAPPAALPTQAPAPAAAHGGCLVQQHQPPGQSGIIAATSASSSGVAVYIAANSAPSSAVAEVSAVQAAAQSEQDELLAQILKLQMELEEEQKQKDAADNHF